jgi:hypothetical protein
MRPPIRLGVVSGACHSRACVNGQGVLNKFSICKRVDVCVGEGVIVGVNHVGKV